MVEPKYYDVQINLYVTNVEISVRFYSENFGFVETFRTPKEGTPVHVELKLGNFVLGLAHIGAAKSMHGLDVGGGKPSGEVLVWTDNVDNAYTVLINKGVKSISKPHTFLDTLRAAWVADPDGYPIEIVTKLK